MTDKQPSRAGSVGRRFLLDLAENGRSGRVRAAARACLAEDTQSSEASEGDSAPLSRQVEQARNLPLRGSTTPRNGADVPPDDSPAPSNAPLRLEEGPPCER